MSKHYAQGHRVPGRWAAVFKKAAETFSHRDHVSKTDKNWALADSRKMADGKDHLLPSTTWESNHLIKLSSRMLCFFFFNS